MPSDPILDFFEVIIPQGGVVHYWHYFVLLFRHTYIFITNIRFLGFLPQGVLEFLNVSYQEVFQKNFPFNYRIFYTLYGKNLVHIYNVNNEKIGFALFRSGPRENIHLCSMGILHKFRGKGLSKPHLSESLARWKQAGFKSSSLYVENTNIIAVKTYTSLGYQPMKSIDDMLYMTKML
jgi:ribosomal protein S18 acetylase RimI-like enzyme